jgi:hypothetical protein
VDLGKLEESVRFHEEKDIRTTREQDFKSDLDTNKNGKKRDQFTNYNEFLN